MDSYLEVFLEEQKAKVAAEKALLDQDPPYMEIRTQTGGAYDFSRKENIPPVQERYVARVKETGLNLPLWEQYERKKKRLQQELCEDYRCYIAQVQDCHSTLRTAPETPDVLIHQSPPASQYPLLSTRDVATLTEAEPRLPREHSRLMEADTRVGNLSGVVMDGDSELDGSEEEMDFPDQGQDSKRHRISHSSQQQFRYRTNRVPKERRSVEIQRRHDDYRERRVAELLESNKDFGELKSLERHRGHADYKECSLKLCGGYDGCRERRRPGFHQGSDNCRERRALELHGGCEDYQQRRSHLKPETTSVFVRPQDLAVVQSRERSRSTVDNVKPQFATGLMIGVREAEEEQMRRRSKEHYRQELQEQIAQQQRNRKREKDLELQVAATGANDPEKRPNRILHLSSGQRAHQQQPRSGLGNLAWRSLAHDHLPEEREPPGRPRVAFQSPLPGALAGMTEVGAIHLKEDSQRGFWNKLEPSSPSVAPLRASSLSDSYRPLLDKVQDWYGGRRWLSPSWTRQEPAQDEVPGLMMHSAAQGTSLSGSQPAVADWTGAAPSAGRNLQSNQAVLSYRDELKRQIQERQEQRRHEEEQRKHYEAKLEDEMRAYNPWGRSGGGAPLKDQLGNLITDLNQMHKSNEEAYLHPELRWEHGGPEPWSSPLRLSGQSSAEMSTSVPGCVSAEPPTLQPPHQQDTYKEFLRQQIEERRRRQAEERERLRLVDKKDDERVAMERAKMLQEYEEEQEKRKQKEIELKAKNEELFRQAEKRRREELRRQQQEEEEALRKQEEEEVLWKQQQQEEEEALRRQQEEEEALRRQRQQQEEEEEALQRQQRQEEEQSKEEKQSQPTDVVFREPLLPISAMQRRGPQLMPRLPSADQCSTVPQLKCLVPPPRSPPVPARRNQLRAEEERQVILNKLSALSRRLRAEQKHLEEQLLQSDFKEQASPLRVRSTERPLLGTFDMNRLSRQGSVQKPFLTTTASFDIQNNFRPSEQRDSNHPAQYAALQGPHDRHHSVSSLRGKQCTIGSSLRRMGIRDNVRVAAEDEYSRCWSSDQFLQSSLLESESTFIGPKGQTFSVPAKPKFIGRPSARERRRLTRTTAIIDETQPSNSSLSTECCLRPNTSSSLKHLLTTESPGQSVSSRPLVPTWEGPSTYHG